MQILCRLIATSANSYSMATSAKLYDTFIFKNEIHSGKRIDKMVNNGIREIFFCGTNMPTVISSVAIYERLCGMPKHFVDKCTENVSESVSTYSPGQSTTQLAARMIVLSYLRLDIGKENLQDSLFFPSAVFTSAFEPKLSLVFRRHLVRIVVVPFLCQAVGRVEY